MLVVGIISATAVSFYTHIIFDTNLQTISDQLDNFFVTCRYRAKMRKIPVKIAYKNGTFSADNSSHLFLRLPEIVADQTDYLNSLHYSSDGILYSKDSKVTKLAVSLLFPGNKTHSINVSF